MIRWLEIVICSVAMGTAANLALSEYLRLRKSLQRGFMSLDVSPASILDRSGRNLAALGRRLNHDSFAYRRLVK